MNYETPYTLGTDGPKNRKLEIGLGSASLAILSTTTTTTTTTAAGAPDPRFSLLER